MPSYANQIVLGEGKFRARVAFEGWPEIFVTDASLVGSSTETPVRSQILGLDPHSIRIAASVDMMRAELTEQEQTFEIEDDSEVVRGYILRNGSVTASLSKKPTQVTSLTLDLALLATTATVSSTDGFATSGVIHIGTEAMAHSGKNATQFTGLTREIWGTKQQAHFTGDGERLAYPQVTDRPRSMRGRRALVYLYGLADSSTGTGTLRWRGISRTDISYNEGRYSIAVEPESWIMEQPIGGALEEPSPIRGIYLPSAASIRFFIERLGAATSTSAGTTDENYVELSGFWATQEAFVDALNTEIATAISGWSWDASTSIVAQSDGPEGWRLVYRVGDTTAYWLRVGLFKVIPDQPARGASPVDLVTTPESGDTALWWDTIRNGVVTTLVKDQQYEIRFSAPVPRAVFGEAFTPTPTNPYFYDADGTFPNNRIYLGGNVIPTTAMMAIVMPTGSEGDDDRPFARASTVSTGLRYIEVSGYPTTRLSYQTRVRLLQTLAERKTLTGFLTALLVDSPGLVNTGVMPLITSGDLDVTFGDLAAAERTIRAARRTWVTSEGVSLKEILTHEAMLLGVYPALDATGKITWVRLRPPLATDGASFTLTGADIGPGMPAVSRAPEGHLREVVFRQGWDPVETEHTGLSIRVRDVQGADPSPLGGVLEIAPRSIAVQRGRYGLELDPLDCELLAMVVLGMFGGSYRTITVEASLRHFAAVLGSRGSLTTALLPDSDGTMGVSALPVTLTGYDWSPFEGRGTLTLQASELNVAGYSPGFLVASQINDAGNQWTISVTLTGYTGSTDVSDWLAIGDEVRVTERNTVSPTRVSGTVDALPGATSVQVTFDGVWTPAGGTAVWTLGADDTDAVDEAAATGRTWAQSDFAKTGGTDRRAALASGDVAATDFSP